MAFNTCFHLTTAVPLVLAVCSALGGCASLGDGAASARSADGPTDGPREGAVARRPQPRVPSRAEAVPTAAEVFDFHPPGSRPGSWREPFIVSYTEGPLNAYRLKTLADLRTLQDHRFDLMPPLASR